MPFLRRTDRHKARDRRRFPTPGGPALRGLDVIVTARSKTSDRIRTRTCRGRSIRIGGGTRLKISSDGDGETDRLHNVGAEGIAAAIRGSSLGIPPGAFAAQVDRLLTTTTSPRASVPPRVASSRTSYDWSASARNLEALYGRAYRQADRAGSRAARALPNSLTITRARERFEDAAP